jgi:hypothetical protein
VARLGFGKHIWNIDPGRVSSIQLVCHYYVIITASKISANLIQLFYISQIFYVLVQVLTKISILLLYLRLFPQPWFKIAAIAAMVFIGLHGVIFCFVVAFQCLPVYSIWNNAIPSQCLNEEAIVFVGAGSSIFQDFLVLALPIPCIKTLAIRTGKRVSLAIMFSMGSLYASPGPSLVRVLMI